MNKTVNINLGGMFFHIDEDAYHKLQRYFDAIKRSLSNSTGKDEIMKDIEMRIAEILMERNVGEKQVVSLRDVEAVITVMGQPEDYRIEDEEGPAQTFSGDWTKRRKKLYRDTEKGMIAGVATGLGHYTGLDPVWVKILFIVLAIASFGTGVVVYLVMWIVTPAAVTTSEKLEMTGEPVNISNIEKKVREEFDMVSEKFKNADYQKMGRNMQTGAERFAHGFLGVLGKIFKVIGKVIGAIIAATAACFLTAAVIGLVTFGSIKVFGMPLEAYAEAFNYSDFPLWALALISFFAISIPVFFLFILGLKLLITNLKSIGNFAKYSLLAIWILSIGFLTAFGVSQASAIAEDGKSVSKEILNTKAGDTLSLKFVYNDYYSKNLYSHHEARFEQTEKGENVIYSDEVSLTVLPTDQPQAYLQIERTARGSSMNDARQRAEKIKYGYKIEGNTVILDNYLLSPTDAKYRKQRVVVYLFVPQGMFFKPDSSVQNNDWSDDNFFNLHYSGDYKYRVDKDRMRCLDCPAEENDWDDLDVNLKADSSKAELTGTMINGRDTLKFEARTIRSEAERLKPLSADANGVIIKSE